MVKHIETIRRQQSTNCLSVFDYFVKLALKGLIVLFAKIVNGLKSLTIFAKSFILDVWLGSECASVHVFCFYYVSISAFLFL